MCEHGHGDLQGGGVEGAVGRGGADGDDLRVGGPLIEGAVEEEEGHDGEVVARRGVVAHADAPAVRGLGRGEGAPGGGVDGEVEAVEAGGGLEAEVLALCAGPPHVAVAAGGGDVAHAAEGAVPVGAAAEDEDGVKEEREEGEEEEVGTGAWTRHPAADG